MGSSNFLTRFKGDYNFDRNLEDHSFHHGDNVVLVPNRINMPGGGASCRKLNVLHVHFHIHSVLCLDLHNAVTSQDDSAC